MYNAMQSALVEKDENREVENASLVGIENVPFSVLSQLFHDLRLIRSRKRPRGLQALEKATETKQDRLRRCWMLIAENCSHSRDVFANRRSDDVIQPAQIFPPQDSLKIISLILPMLDPVHTYIGMKETKLADAFTRALDLVRGSDNAEWLRNYKDKQYRPEKWKLSSDITDGNFPSVLKAILQGRCPTVSTMTIGDVWNALDDISESSNVQYHRISRPNYKNIVEAGKHLSEKEKRTKRIDALRSIVQASTADEVTEFARILLKDTEISLSQDGFFAWFHPFAKQHYNQTHDIMKLLHDCHSPNFKMGDVTVQVGRYASVMLTQRPSRKNLKYICERLNGEGDRHGMKSDASDVYSIAASQFITGEKPSVKYFLIEPKLDGERMELHMTRTYNENGQPTEVEVQTFSRKGNDSSDMYADALRNVISDSVRAQSIILDGEIMIWDSVREWWIPFSRFRDVATGISRKRVAEGSSYVLKFMIFDVLYVDQGIKRSRSKAPHMVVRLPLHGRRKLLEQIVEPKIRDNFPGLKSAVEIVAANRGQSEDDFLNAMQEYCSLGYEGVIAKHPDMAYAIGQRNADIGVKLKPDYFDGGLQDVDVVVLGARLSTSYSRAGRSGDISTFLIGVREEGSEMAGREIGVGSSEGRWVPVGSVGTGYSDNDLSRIRDQLNGHWQDLDVQNLPPHISRRAYPKMMFKDVVKWIPPSKSVVLTIRAYELNRKHTTLRFARVERINWEKPIKDVITLQELEILDDEKTPAFVCPDENDGDDTLAGDGGLWRTPGRNSAKNELEEAAIARATAEGATISGGRSARKVIAFARGTSVDDVMVIGDAFENMKFHVVGAVRTEKEEIEVMIHELGGKFVQNLTKDVDYIVGLDPMHLALSKLLTRFEKNSNAEDVRPVLRPTWVESCHKKKLRLDIKWPDLLFAPPVLEKKLLKNTDRFGDSWEENATSTGLLLSTQEVHRVHRESTNAAKYPPIVHVSANALIDAALRKVGMVFRGCTVYVPDCLTYNVTGAALLVQLLGGRVVRIFEENMEVSSKVLVHAKCTAEWSEKAKSMKNGAKLEVVTDECVRACLREGKFPQKYI